MNKDKFALISVYTKTNIEVPAKILTGLGYKIIASPGTTKYLKDHKISALPAEIFTNNPDALKDCIQTISFNLQAGILHDHKKLDHIKQVKKLSISPIDVVICNFPPVDEMVKKPSDFNIQHVDVGGPLMVHAAAVNHKDVSVFVDKIDYRLLQDSLKQSSKGFDIRQRLATKAFQYCVDYDNSIINYLKSN